MKSHLRRIEKRTVGPKRRPNVKLRTEYLPEAEVAQLTPLGSGHVSMKT
jgi:hypothetical protein